MTEAECAHKGLVYSDCPVHLPGDRWRWLSICEDCGRQSGITLDGDALPSPISHDRYNAAHRAARR